MNQIGYSSPASALYRLEKPLPVQYPLVNRFYKQCGYRVNCGRLEQVYSLRDMHSVELHAAVRFLSQENYWLLRNLCVVTHRRGQGLARLLLGQILQLTWQPETAVGCYCFSLGHLQTFYESLGFQTMLPEQTPAAIAESYQRYSQHQPHLVLMGLVGRLNFS